MSRGYDDFHKDPDSEAEVARRRSFLDRMNRKYEGKLAMYNAGLQAE